MYCTYRHACMYAYMQTGTDRNIHRQAETDEDRQRLKDIHTLQVNLHYITLHHITSITSHLITVQYIPINYSIYVFIIQALFTCAIRAIWLVTARLMLGWPGPSIAPRGFVCSRHTEGAQHSFLLPLGAGWSTEAGRRLGKLPWDHILYYIVFHHIIPYYIIEIYYIYILLYYILCYFLSYYILVYYDSWDVAPFMLHHHFPTIIAIRRFTLFRDTHMHVYFQPCNQREGNTIIFRTVKKTWTKQNSLKNHVSMGRVTNVFHMCIYIYTHIIYIYTHIIYIYLYSFMIGENQPLFWLMNSTLTYIYIYTYIQ